MAAKDIHTEFHRFLGREDKERLLGQRGVVLWMCGLSGSGKSTVANAAERTLHEEGRLTAILDGDNLRAGLNSDLGFSDEDRAENIRRNAELARLFASQGIITFVPVITPRRDFRRLARRIIGQDFREIHIRADYETCARRDPKGLYAKAASGELRHFTGKDSGFEPPETPDLLIDTSGQTIRESRDQILAYLRPLVARPSTPRQAPP